MMTLGAGLERARSGKNSSMMKSSGLCVALDAVTLGAQRVAPHRSFNTVINLETTPEDSANVRLRAW